MSWSNYTYQKPESAEPGDYRCVIIDAAEGRSRSGNNMITLTLRPSGHAINVKSWLVDNEYFDANVSRFLDAFPVLKEGFSPDECFTWRGAQGAVKLVTDDKGYLAVGRFIPAEKAEKLPPFEWRARDSEPQEMPVYYPCTALTPETEEEDGCPF